MADPKVAIRLKDYKVAKGKNADGIQLPGHDVKQCIIWVNPKTYVFLGAPEYEFEENLVERPNPVNVEHYNTTVRGTRHGKTIFIKTDGQGGDNYPKVIQMQMPGAYPIAFVADFLKERQADPAAPCRNKLRSVKIRNGYAIPIPVAAGG